VNNDLRVNPFFNVGFGFFEEFSSQKCNTGGAITNFIVLCFSDIDEDTCSWVDYIE